MKERPILFSGAMVRALLDGSKTQTRRVVKHQPSDHHWQCLPGYVLRFTLAAFQKALGLQYHHTIPHNPNPDSDRPVMCPYGQPGDRLWVRETWQYYDWDDIGEPCIRFQADNAATWPIPSSEDWDGRLADIWASLSNPENYSIDQHARDRRWRPSIHMPRWASRILLEIVSVRVEQLNEISEDDCWAEGIDACDGLLDDMQIIRLAKQMGHCIEDARPTYAALWESINGAGSWAANPWVWCIEFRRVTP